MELHQIMHLVETALNLRPSLCETTIRTAIQFMVPVTTAATVLALAAACSVGTDMYKWYARLRASDCTCGDTGSQEGPSVGA